jgi:hypothetical protein
MPTYDNASLTYDAGTTSYDGAPGAIAGLPQATIEIAFDDGPYVWEPYWTDVTEYVRSVNVRRGRNDDLSPFVGTASVELDNRDRRFDPFNTSGVYYGKLLPRRQIRIRAAAGANTYDVFRGYVAGWPTSYTEAGFDATVTLDCFDALAFLASTTTPANLSDSYIKEFSPYIYVKCDDIVSAGGTPTLVDSGSFGKTLTQTGAGTITNTSSLASGIPHGSLALETNNCTFSSLVSGTGRGANDLTVAFWLRPRPVSATAPQLVEGGKAVYFKVEVSNTVVVKIYDNGFEYRYDSAGNAYNNSEMPLHIGFVWNTTSKTASVYVNGIAISATLSSAANVGPNNNGLLIQNVQVQQIVVIDGTRLTGTQMNTLYNYGIGAYFDQNKSRVARLMRYSGFPADADSSYIAVGGYNIINASSANEYVQELNNNQAVSDQLKIVSASEGGELMCGADGRIYLTPRDSQNYLPSSIGYGRDTVAPYNPVVPQATFSDAVGTALPYGPNLDVEWDADGIINDLTIQYTDGGAVTVIDSTSQTANGLRTSSIATQLAATPGLISGDTPLSYATDKIAYFRHVIPRVSPLDVGMTRDLTDWQTLLALELMDAFAVQRTPSVGSALDFRLQVQAIDHQIVPGDWRMRVTGSARYANWFTADVDDADGARLAV